MRTTIRMKTELARRAKAFATKTNRTFTELVEDALVEALDRGNQTPVKLPPITVVRGTRQITEEELKRSIEEMDREEDLSRLGYKNDSAA